jgi:cell cycle checkpoint protein
MMNNMIRCLKFQSAVLKETIDDLEWPGSSIQIRMQPDPPTVILKGEGHGDLQVRFTGCPVIYVHLAPSCAYDSLSLITQIRQTEFPYYANTDLLIVFQCEHEVSHR